MKIKRIKINNFIGVEELNWNPGNINVIEGPKGSGKTSITEALEKAITNNQRRTEVIRHGADEALLFVETDEGLEIDRRLRNGKSDYLKLTGNMVAKSTEGELRKFLAGDIFRPLDFIDLTIAEQTEIILSMIKMDYPTKEINNWFGEDVLSNINTSKHLLQILKDIESKYYKERQEVNREIKTLEAQVKGIEAELPANYNGEDWKDKKVQEYYDKVSKARDLNEQIENARNLKENFENIIAKIKAEAENDKSRIESKYQQEKQDIKDLIQLKKDEIGKNKKNISNLETLLDQELKDVDAWFERKVQELKEKSKELKEQHIENFNQLKETKKEEIQSINQDISAKTSELNGLDEKKELELQSVDKEIKQKIKLEDEKVGQAKKLLEEKKPIDIEPLQEEADKVAEMREHLHEWNRMVDIRDGKLAKKEIYSDKLTNLIEIAREKPAELLKQHKLPLEGISVDEESRIRINDTLLDGLSDGEKLEVAFKLALQRMGKLRIMCLDGFEKLNESEQNKVLKMCEDEDIQVFVTITKEIEEMKIRSDK